MGEREDLIKGVRKFKERLSRERKTERVILFGSRLRKVHRRDSDVDLIIVSPSFRGVKSSRSFGLRKYWTLDLPVDFICYTPDEFEEKKRQVSIVSEALKDGVVI